jgi:hypothetical protein
MPGLNRSRSRRLVRESRADVWSFGSKMGARCATRLSSTAKKSGASGEIRTLKHLFYKRGCQGTFFSLHRRRGCFPRHPAPLSTEDACLVSCPLVWLVPYQRVHLPGLRRRWRFLKLGKRCGCTVSTMVLSEARGLVLFRVVRGGIGFTQRLGARHRAPTGV